MRKQLLAQKIIVIFAISIAAVGFAMALGFMTVLDITLKWCSDPSKGTYFPGAEVYIDAQAFDRTLVALMLASILVSVSLFVTGTGKRRKYYIGNYVAVGATSAMLFATSIFSFVGAIGIKKQYLALDFEALEAWTIKNDFEFFYKSTVMFDLNIVAAVLVLITSLALVGNLIWKILLMKEENRLLSTSIKDNNAEVVL